MNPWHERKCVPCRGGTPVLSKAQALEWLREFEGWTLSENAQSIRVEYRMKNFSSAMKLINQIAEIAQAQDHHPDIHLTGYRRLSIELSTHAIGGLSENDFILAAKISRLPKELKISATERGGPAKLFGGQ